MMIPVTENAASFVLPIPASPASIPIDLPISPFSTINNKLFPPQQVACHKEQSSQEQPKYEVADIFNRYGVIMHFGQVVLSSVNKKGKTLYLMFMYL